jgi:(2R)-ethylmalonyl-CoA mutase
MAVDPEAERSQIERLNRHRAERDGAAVDAALAELEQAAKDGRNIMEPSIRAAHAGVTTGEWGDVFRRVFGEYRAPTGVAGVTSKQAAHTLDPVRAQVEAVSARLGRRIKMLVGKPGLDGHSNGAEQIAVAARDCGMEVVYEGIRLTPARICGAALEEGVHVVGLSILSGSHMPLVRDCVERMRQLGIGDVPLVVGGIIPPEDEKQLLAMGVARVYTPKDFSIAQIMADIVDIVDAQGARAA